MGTAYTEFSCLGSDLLSTIQTAILASADWARPNAGSKPTLFKATTSRGAQMCVDLADTALATHKFNIAVYRTHDGTTGVDKVTRWLYMLSGARGTLAANTYHGVVSAGKEHLFLSVEGPYATEANNDNGNYGSQRQCFWISDVVPYFDSSVDPTPAVCIGGQLTDRSDSATLSVDSHVTAISRNPADTASWNRGKMLTLCFPQQHVGSESVGWQQNAYDGHQYLAPYVYFDDSTGIRGRLAAFFFAGWLINTASYETPGVPPGGIVTYGGDQYKLLAPTKSGSGNQVYSQFGATVTNNGTDHQRSAVIAVPYA